MHDLCGGSVRPWLTMPFDVKSDRDTAHGELVWCDACGMGFARRMPEPHEVAAHYDLPRYYTQGASHIPEIPPGVLDRLLIKAAWLLDRGAPVAEEEFAALVPPPGPALDIGCGGGDRLRRLAALGYDAIGVEPDPAARERARASGLEVLEGTAERLPPRAAGAGARIAILSHVLEHCLDPVAALQGARDALGPDGLLYCEEAGLEIVGWRHHGFTRHFAPGWRAWENSIRRRLIERGAAPAAPSRSAATSVRLLIRALGASADEKYDCIGFLARRRTSPA